MFHLLVPDGRWLTRMETPKGVAAAGVGGDEDLARVRVPQSRPRLVVVTANRRVVIDTDADEAGVGRDIVDATWDRLADRVREVMDVDDRLADRVLREVMDVDDRALPCAATRARRS